MPMLSSRQADIPYVLHSKALVSTLATNANVSKTEARRLLKNGAVSYQGPDDDKFVVDFVDGVPLEGGILRVGKHKFLKLPVQTKRLTIEVWDELPPPYMSHAV